jgi:hypothetical protein
MGKIINFLSSFLKEGVPFRVEDFLNTNRNPSPLRVSPFAKGDSQFYSPLTISYHSFVSFTCHHAARILSLSSSDNA